MPTFVTDRHYVYLYRDPGTAKAVYVGYGAELSRCDEHRGRSHSAPFRSWLAAHPEVAPEAAGPFGNEKEARAVERALIGALQPPFNTLSRNTFRAVGVPAPYVARLADQALLLDELPSHTGSAVLVVLVTGHVSDSGRVPLDFSRLTDTAVRAHADRWWQLDRHITEWRARPETAPETLVAVSGAPARRYVLCSALIDRTAWSDPLLILRALYRQQGGLWRVPLAQGGTLDAHQLRGRRITNALFTQSRSGIIRVLR